MCQFRVRYRIPLSVCSLPNICFRDKNLQSHSANGYTGFERLATRFDSVHNCMLDAHGSTGFVHHLCGGK